jgi:hypothetical protein
MARSTHLANQNSFKNLRPFKPGQSGNPSGRSKRYQELFDAIASQVGGEGGLTAMEREYISRAAEHMRQSERAKDNNERVRLTRCAMGLVDRVRDMRRERGAKTTVPLPERVAAKFGSYFLARL